VPRRAPIDRAEAEVRSAQIKALADPIRLQILSLLLSHPSGEARPGELTVAIGVSGPNLSHHLKLLFEAGLVEREKRLTTIYYRPAHDALARFAALIAAAKVAESPGAEQGRSTPTHAQPTHSTHVAVPRGVSQQLAVRFAGVFSVQTVERYVEESYQMLAERAKITRFLPSLTANFAAERLAALARSRGLTATAAPEVLFVCVHNAGRSQMAAALLLQLVGERVHVRSAGSHPASVLDPSIAQVMDEIGVHLGGVYPKPLTDEVVRAADYVITMGCGDACPIYPGKRYLDWPIPDPSGKALPQIRSIRDDITTHVQELAEELRAASHSTS
jgi:arsenate reductase